MEIEKSTSFDAELVIIEDEKSLQRRMTKELKSLNLPSRCFEHYKDIIDVEFEEERFKIFIVDLNLGDQKRMEGLKVIAWIKDNLQNAYTIVHSAWNDLEDDCLNKGADFFLPKRTRREHQKNDFLKLRNFIGNLSPVGNIISENNVLKKFVTYGKIDDIGDSFYIVNCHLGNNPRTGKSIFVKKKYPHYLFVKFKSQNLYIGAPIIIDSIITNEGLAAQKIHVGDRDFPDNLFNENVILDENKSEKWNNYLNEEE